MRSSKGGGRGRAGGGPPGGGGASLVVGDVVAIVFVVILDGGPGPAVPVPRVRRCGRREGPEFVVVVGWAGLAPWRGIP